MPSMQKRDMRTSNEVQVGKEREGRKLFETERDAGQARRLSAQLRWVPDGHARPG